MENLCKSNDRIKIRHRETCRKGTKRWTSETFDEKLRVLPVFDTLVHLRINEKSGLTTTRGLQTFTGFVRCDILWCVLEPTQAQRLP